MTELQLKLKEAIQTRTSETVTWINDKLYAGNERDAVRLLFDDPGEVYGCQVQAIDLNSPLARTCFYEALRIGKPESLPSYIAECQAAGLPTGAPE